MQRVAISTLRSWMLLAAWAGASCSGGGNDASTANPSQMSGAGQGGSLSMTPMASGSGGTGIAGGSGGAGTSAAGMAGMAGIAGMAGTAGMTGAAGMAGAAPNQPVAGSAGAAAGSSGSGGEMPDPPVSCPTPSLSPGMSRESIEVSGTTREFLLQIPEGYTGDEPVPLVIDFHPLFFDGAFQRGNSGYRQLANREGFIVAWPDGIDGAWDIGPCCVDADDEGFARALVAWISERACVDPKRVYAAGFSMGGGMSHFAACSMSDVFAAVAPAAFDLLEEMTCEPARPISVLMFRGTLDGIVPYGGGASDPPNAYPGPIHFLGAEGSFARWAELNGCTDQPMDLGGGCKTHTQCEAGVEVTLCTATGGGHSTGDAEMGWEMFQRQPMP